MPAFPVLDSDNIGGQLTLACMGAGFTKREMLAGMAMQGLLSTLSPGLYDANTIATYVYEAVKAADYLLEELSKTQP